VEQTQKVDANNPAYAFTLPLVIKTGDARLYKHLDIDTKTRRNLFSLTAKPSDVVVDPDSTFASSNRIAKPLAMWLRQIDDDSVFAQLQAARGAGRILRPRGRGGPGPRRRG
jgi:hypothetical protein